MKFNKIFSGSSGNLYTLELTKHKSILIDPGVPYSKLIKHVDLNKVMFCLLSHSHSDHSKAIPELLNKGLACIMHEVTAKELGVATSPFAFQLPHSMLFNYFRGIYLNAVETKHDVKNMWFEIQYNNKILTYITDTPYIDTSKFTKYPDILAIECNYSIQDLNYTQDTEYLKRVISSHMSLTSCIGAIKKLGVFEPHKQIHLLHLSDNNSDAKKFIAEIRKHTSAQIYI